NARGKAMTQAQPANDAGKYPQTSVFRPAFQKRRLSNSHHRAGGSGRAVYAKLEEVEPRRSVGGVPADGLRPGRLLGVDERADLLPEGVVDAKLYLAGGGQVVRN